MATVIDTLKVSRTLEDAGFAKAQADVVAATFAEVFSAAHEDLVTKDFLRAQLGELRGDLKAEIAGSASDLRTEVAGSASDLRTEVAGSASDLRTEVAGLKSDLRTEIANSKIEVIRWMIGSQVMLIVALVALANFTKLL